MILRGDGLRLFKPANPALGRFAVLRLLALRAERPHGPDRRRRHFEVARLKRRPHRGAFPSAVGRLLLNAELSGAAIVTARIAGIGLLSLGLACWPNSETTRSASRGMLVYNLLVTLYLASLGIRGEWTGILLWPAVLFHAGMTMVFARGQLAPIRL